MKNKIFALVGPSGSGKSTLIKEVAAALSSEVGVIKSLTTRAEKDELDTLFYIFITQQEFRKKQFAGELIE